jgi:hypothetical protein
MYYTIYKITNQIDGKFYIGSHKTKNLDDNYMGSGKYLKHAQEKYGIENFKKEILFVFDNPEEMYAKEAEIVTEEFITTQNTYNLKVGGFGGWDYVNENEELRVAKNRMARISADKAIFEKHGVDNAAKTMGARKKLSEMMKNRILNGFVPSPPSFKGKKHSYKSKKVIGEKNSATQKGNKNSQYNTMWITDGQISKKIKKTDVIPEGWKKGRIIKRA